MVATRQVYIKPANLKLIDSGKIEGTKLSAYKRLLYKSGSPISKGRLKGAMMIYIGNLDYIGLFVKEYKGGYSKLNFLTDECMKSSPYTDVRNYYKT